MTFNWREFLDVANELAGVATTRPAAGLDARRRAAVSRAYYAVFGTLRADRGVSQARSGGNPHRALVNHLVRSDDAMSQAAGRTLDRLRQLRNRCDYDPVLQDLPQLYEVSLSDAEALLSEFE